MPLLLVTLMSSYVSWSAFWGWHVGEEKWESVYLALKKVLRLNVLIVVLLTIIRMFAALIVGVVGGNFRQFFEAIYVLQKNKP
ncbi:MAG: hypothetical protein ACREOO_17525 [bacterium]